MSANAPKPPSPEVWRVEALRLTTFPLSPAFEVSQGWWQEVVGTDPESATERRQKFEREVSGPFHGAELTLAVDLTRVQWSVTPIRAMPPEFFQTIGTFLDFKEVFRVFTSEWLNVCGIPLKRVALGGVLFQQEDSGIASYERLNQYLRRVDLPTDCSDFNFRVNRRIPATRGIPGTSINRLCTWNSMKQTHRVLAGDSLDLSTLQSAPGGEVKFATRFEFDINTAPQTTALDAGGLSELYDEFFDMALALAALGDEAL